MDVGAAISFGLLGGVAAEVLKWFGIREKLHLGFPDYAKTWPYWLVTALMILTGCGLVVAYQVSSEVRLNPILAVNIGASAPLILSSLASRTPSIEDGKVDCG